LHLTGGNGTYRLFPWPSSFFSRARHRINRGGDRQANGALWRIAIVRLSHDQRTRDYLARRTKDGHDTGDVLRCLKRYIARQVFAALPRELRDQAAEQAAA
jgi:transposase